MYAAPKNTAATAKFDSGSFPSRDLLSVLGGGTSGAGTAACGDGIGSGATDAGISSGSDGISSIFNAQNLKSIPGCD